MGARDIVILGYDAISPLGIDLEHQWQQACAGESGIGPLTRFPLADDFPVRIAGQLPDLTGIDHPFLAARQLAMWSSPVFRYALLSVIRALARSGVEITETLAPRVAVTYGTAIGGLDAVVNADRRLQTEQKLPHPYANPNSCINMVGGKIAIETGARGPITTPISACATGLSSLIVAALLLNQGRADVAICGAVDCALIEPIVAGFYTMNGIYIPKPGREDDPPATASRPFSIDRRGFVLAEGAAALIIATREFADAHGLPYRCVIAGWGMTSDAHHFVAPHLPTVTQCIHDAIGDAGITPEDIAAINTHAASTKIGDAIEYQALRTVFSEAMPPLTANKSLIGHAMGASSGIEAVYTLLGMEHDVLLPTINYRPDPELPIDCIADTAQKLSQEFVLKNSFGFGGCNASIIFQALA